MNEEERAAFEKEFGKEPPSIMNRDFFFTKKGAEWALKFAADRLARERAKALNDMTVPR